MHCRYKYTQAFKPETSSLSRTCGGALEPPPSHATYVIENDRANLSAFNSSKTQTFLLCTKPAQTTRFLSKRKSYVCCKCAYGQHTSRNSQLLTNNIFFLFKWLSIYTSTQGMIPRDVPVPKWVGVQIPMKTNTAELPCLSQPHIWTLLSWHSVPQMQDSKSA